MIQKKSESGSSNQVNARIFIGLSEILDLAQIDYKDKKEIQAYLFRLTRNLNYAQASSLKVIKEYQVKEKELIQFKNGQSQKFPSLLFANEAELFLYHTKKALNDIAFIVGLIFSRHKINEEQVCDENLVKAVDTLNKALLSCDLKSQQRNEFTDAHKRIITGKKVFDMYKGAKFDKISKDLARILPTDAILLKMLEMYQPWIVQLLALRNLDQHPVSPDELITNYRIDIKGNIASPQFSEGTPLYEFLQVSSAYIFAFSEDVILLSLYERLPDIFEIIEIPKEERNQQCPKRFKVVPLGME